MGTGDKPIDVTISNKDCDSCIAQGPDYWWSGGVCGKKCIIADAPGCYQDCDRMRKDIELNKKCSAAQGSCSKCAGIDGCIWYNNACSTGCGWTDAKCAELAIMDDEQCGKPAEEAKYFCESKQYTQTEIEAFD